jgi:hypothetical protein
MKKFSLFFILLIVYSINTSAQTPQYYNYNTTNSGNSFPFNQQAGKMCQWLFLPGEFSNPSPAPSDNISKLYCRMAANLGPWKYWRLYVLFCQTTLTSLPVGAFYSNPMDTVYLRDTVTISAPAGGWLVFNLDHSYAFDSSKSLIIQIEQCAAEGATGYSLAQTTLSGIRRSWSVGCGYPFFYSGQDNRIMNCGIDFVITKITEPSVNSQIPTEYNLEQNYPNPFNPVTQITFDIPKNGFVTLKIYDVLGREITTLVNGVKNPGRYIVEFDGSQYSSGIYFYRLESDEFTDVKKMILIK